MKRLFIIFFLTSINSFSQIQKDSIATNDSLIKIELKNKITALQSKLDSLLKNEKKEV